ncbi:MAG TPA: serine hydrolase domain-containing protein [Burkholderiaceae bacterium]
MKLRAPLLLSLIFAATSAQAQLRALPPSIQPGALLATPLPAAELAQKIDAIVTSQSPHPFSGAVLITQGDRAVYLRAIGQQRRVDDRNPQPDSQFLIGSITKQFTAALVMREAQAKRLDVNLPIRQYLPEMADSWTFDVTTAQLLNQTAGVDAAGKPLKWPAGSRFEYNNYNYELLGAILERVTGEKYADLAASMFRSCKMKDTLIAPPEAVPTLLSNYPRLVAGYNELNDGTFRPETGRRNLASAPAGSAMSTLNDLARWNECLHLRTLVSGNAYDAMTTASPNAVRANHRWGTLGYGYGMQLSRKGEMPEISHNGYVGGYISTLIYYPADRVGIVILENTAWNSNDLNRAFYAHDAVRDAVRNYLAGGLFNWRGMLPQ